LTTRLAVLAALAALLVAGCGGSSRPKGPPALVFVSVKEGDYAIYGADADGKHAYRLTDHEADPSTPEGLFWQNDPAWSSDGSEIAFTSNRDGRTHVFVMTADGTGTRRVTNTQHSDDHPSWSPDGRWIVFAREGAIYRVRESGGAAARVGSGLGAAADPAYSPDGKLIAYDYRQPGSAVKDVFVMRDDGTGARRVTDLRDVSTAPAWSPDGKTLAFQSSAGGGHAEIYTVPLAGGTPTRLTSSAIDAIQPDWTTDGTGITFSRDGALVTVAVAGGKETQLTSGDDNDSAPAWRPVAPK
jgi:Tol biopolymer transport system component